MRPVARLGGSACALLAAVTPTAAPAQILGATAFGAAVSNSEITSTRQARGIGFGGSARVTLGNFRIEARALHAALHADFSIQPDYNVDQVDLLGTYLWRPYLSFQLGAARRFLSPDFVGQDVGLVRIGVLSETRLARIAAVWMRGGYLPLVRFSGGGSAQLGLEVGLGVQLGPGNGRLQGFAEYEFQHIDRKAGTASVPLQFSVGKAGLRFRP